MLNTVKNFEEPFDIEKKDIKDIKIEESHLKDNCYIRDIKTSTIYIGFLLKETPLCCWMYRIKS